MVLQYSLWFKFKKGVASRLRFNNSMTARGAYKRTLLIEFLVVGCR